MSYGALIAHRCAQRWFPASFLLAVDPGVERFANTWGVTGSNPANQRRRDGVSYDVEAKEHLTPNYAHPRQSLSSNSTELQPKSVRRRFHREGQ